MKKRKHVSRKHRSAYKFQISPKEPMKSPIIQMGIVFIMVMAIVLAFASGMNFR